MTELAEEVAAIAAEAGRYAMDRWQSDFRRWEKAPGNPVCEIDLALDEILRERLTALLPDTGWLSEESVDNPERLGFDRVWVVDPIGRHARLSARPGPAGRCRSRWSRTASPWSACSMPPARGELWCGTAGKGAWRNGALLRAGDRALLAGARVPADQLPRIDFDLTPVFKPNSIALRIAMVAAGEADLVATLRWGNEWDIAAAILLAREAGAAVSDALGGPLHFNHALGRGVRRARDGAGHPRPGRRAAERAGIGRGCSAEPGQPPSRLPMLIRSSTAKPSDS
ncbi:MAG: inositol monophosphatase family protein [Sphingomonas sp.]